MPKPLPLLPLHCWQLLLFPPEPSFLRLRFPPAEGPLHAAFRLPVAAPQSAWRAGRISLAYGVEPREYPSSQPPAANLSTEAVTVNANPPAGDYGSNQRVTQSVRVVALPLVPTW